MYQLVGPIQHAKNVPVWFEEKFVNGFPPSWKTLVDDYAEWLNQQNSDDDSDNDMRADPISKSSKANFKYITF